MARIARAASALPDVLTLLTEGVVTLTTVAMLWPHLTVENHTAVLRAARNKTKREVEEQVARLAPKPGAAPLMRKLPASNPTRRLTLGSAAALLEVPAEKSASTPASPSTRVTPLAEDRYLLRVTISADTQRKLRHAQDLLRHMIPTGDHAAILDRALTLLVDQLERAKFVRTRQARAASANPMHGRHIPAAVRRDV